MQASSANAVSKFWTWWSSELKALVPARPRKDPSRSALTLRILPTAIDIRHSSANEPDYFMSIERHSDILGPKLEQLARQTADRAIAVEISSQLCLSRETIVPLHARHDALEIVLLDLEANSPLRNNDVYVAILNGDSKTSSQSSSVRSLIVKRSVIDPVLKTLADVGFVVSVVEAFDPGTGQPLTAEFAIGKGDTVKQTFGSRHLVTAALAGALVFVATFTWFDRQEQEIARISVLADTLQAQAKELQRRKLVAERRHAQTLEIETVKTANNARLVAINELSKLLPDTTWLTDLDINEKTFLISGYSSAAAKLVSIIDGSPLFDNSQLTAPVVFDEAESKDRFSIRFTLHADLRTSADYDQQATNSAHSEQRGTSETMEFQQR